MSGEVIRHRKRVVRRHYHQKDDANNESYISDDYEQPPRRNGSTRRAEKNLMCNVCDGLAHGYNFDTITCESCKAFFRRNALRPNVHVNNNPFASN